MSIFTDMFKKIYIFTIESNNKFNKSNNKYIFTQQISKNLYNNCMILFYLYLCKKIHIVFTVLLKISCEIKVSRQKFTNPL